MNVTAPTDTVVTNPTYMADIRFFFEQIDIDHMAAKGIDLGTYDGVKRNALAIFAHTSPPNADMPPEPDRKWSAERSLTFKNWIIAGYPVGTAVTSPRAATFAAAAGRLRKNVKSLSSTEVDNLTKAFRALMDKDPTDASSYYAIASQHGLPQSYCLHHEDRYNPWHRVYLKQLEDALRAVPGCADVTLPYWDFSGPVPDLLKAPPFASYKLPVALPAPYPANYQTVRYDQATIDRQFARFDVMAHFNAALKQSLWGVFGQNGFQNESIAAHDGGHLGTGPTMADQNVASYDPIFWFYHCNLDRHWLQWQTNVGATTLTGFKSTLSGNTLWLSPGFNLLPPFATTADQTIDYEGIHYDQPATMMGAEMASFENAVGSLDAARAFTIRRAPKVSIMVKDIDRLNIPGSFVVQLLADGQPVAERAFFQPNVPRDCANCRKLGLVSIDFQLDQDKVVGRKLSVAIEVPTHEGIGKAFPLSSVGNPTINARLLLEDG